MSERAEKCGTCRFWRRDEHPPDSSEGQCRRNAPVVVALPDNSNDPFYRVWPETWVADWCGEYRPVEAP